MNKWDGRTSQTMIRDTGYMLVCTSCSRRHGEMREMINKQREIRWSLCDKCILKKKTTEPILPNQQMAYIK